MTDTLNINDSLTPGQSILSQDGSHTLLFDLDGNVVLSDTATGKPTWSTGTQNVAGQVVTTLFTMQGDGNLVLYANVLEHFQPPAPPIWKKLPPLPPPKPVWITKGIWASNTGGHTSGSFLAVLQNNGNLVVTQTIFASNTAGT
jgi:hypothetical protein